MKVLDTLRQIFLTAPPLPPSDLTAFRESRARFHQSAKRLSKAISDDKLGDMIDRLQHKKRKRTNGG